MTFDIIIPTYKPGTELTALLKGMLIQTLKPDNIFIINTEEKFWKTEFESILPVNVTHIKKSDFDHGATRRMGAELSKADVFICMTQDAKPKDGRLFSSLLSAFSDEKVAIAYARQETDEKAGEIERYTREFNYPDKDRVKTSEDIKTMSIKAWFCSDVCAAYRKSVYNEAGGFVKRTVFNEDMLMAAKVMEMGYKVVYKSDARVIHYHEYNIKQQFSRNFDLGASHREYREVFEKVSSYKEGSRLVKDTVLHLIKVGKFYLVPKLVFHSAAKLVGYKLGKKYDKLPKSLVLKFCMNKDYFK